MDKIVYRQILVVGDNHEEIVKKYSADTKVKPYLKMRFDDAGKERKSYVNFLKNLITDKRAIIPYHQYEVYKDMYHTFLKMDDFDFFRSMTEGCIYDEETGDAYTEENPNAYYQYERCHQHRLEVTGEEGDFSSPFPLKDGGTSYSARFNDIDWKKIHRNKTQVKLAKRVWELVVEYDSPKNEEEENLLKFYVKRLKYFSHFKNKDEYVKHCTSLWYYGIATEDFYKEVDWSVSDKDWVANFYKKYVAVLEKTNPLITIYETKCID